MGSALKNNAKAGHTVELLGCSIEDLRSHLEQQFTPGMTWDNYGVHGWQIDHIIPLSYFNLSDPEQQKRAWHYTNLQPLWAVDNIRKSNKIIEIQLILL
jgi:5-methylcytosine-specific restriction endonuclease McrA